MPVSGSSVEPLQALQEVQTLPPAEQKALRDALTQYGVDTVKRFSSVSSIQYKSEIEISADPAFIAKNPAMKKIEHELAKVAFSAKGSKWAWDEVYTAIAAGELVNSARGAWSGERYQLLERNGSTVPLSITKEKPSATAPFTNSNSLFLPYSFLLEQNTERNAAMCSLDTLVSDGAWKHFLDAITDISMVRLNDAPCIAVTVRYSQDFSLTVYFAKALSGSPVGFDFFDGNGKLRRQYRVLSFSEDKAKFPVPFPQKASYDMADVPVNSTEPMLTCRTVHTITSIVANGNVDDSAFEIDPAVATMIKDLDRGVTIVVPQ